MLKEDDCKQEAVAAVALAAAGALAALPEVLGGGLAAPPLLQLARYGPDGAAYPRHADNDERLAGSPEYTQGPPGLRVCDREVTALLYLNAEGGAWEPGRDGGTLRLWAPGSDAAGGGRPTSSWPPRRAASCSSTRAPSSTRSRPRSASGGLSPRGTPQRPPSKKVEREYPVYEMRRFMGAGGAFRGRQQLPGLDPSQLGSGRWESPPRGRRRARQRAPRATCGRGPRRA